MDYPWHFLSWFLQSVKYLSTDLPRDVGEVSEKLISFEITDTLVTLKRRDAVTTIVHSWW